MVAAGAVSVIPATASSVQTLLGFAATTGSADGHAPVWNTGNLCSSISYGPNPGDVTCVSNISNSKTPLWYNFSTPPNILGGVVNVSIYGSHDCIYINFKSFGSTINVVVAGSGYACRSHSDKGGGDSWSPALGGNDRGDWGHEGSDCSGGHDGWGDSALAGAGHDWGRKPKCAPGVNIVVNSEGDVFNLNQTVEQSSKCFDEGGRGYSTNVTIYGKTIPVTAVQYKGTHDLNTTFTWIGLTAGFAQCPYGTMEGKVSWSETSWGSHNLFATIFVDGTNVVHPPPNTPYSIAPLTPPAGTSYGYHNLYGNETTQIAPPGACHYLEA
jgi:hypothetical protein